MSARATCKNCGELIVLLEVHHDYMGREEPLDPPIWVHPRYRPSRYCKLIAEPKAPPKPKPKPRPHNWEFCNNALHCGREHW